MNCAVSETCIQRLDFLTWQIVLMNRRSFSRMTEQLNQIHQMTLFDVFNEPEFLCDDSKEPAFTDVLIRIPSLFCLALNL